MEPLADLLGLPVAPVTAYVAGLALVVGLVVGSMANVAIVRVPEGESIVRPRSRCPSCGTLVRPRDNVPVVSWLALRGRCRGCGWRIPARYPLVELGMGAAFVAVTLRVGADWLLPALLVATWALVTLAVIDLRTRRVPNRITYPTIPLVLGLAVAGALLAGDASAALRAPLGALAFGGALLVVALARPGGMGMGDVKLAALIGAAVTPLGWEVLAASAMLAFLSGGLVGAALLGSGRRGRKDAVPFGPFLSAGALAGVLVGAELVDWWLGLFAVA